MSAFNEYVIEAAPFLGRKREYYATRRLSSQPGMPVYFAEDNEKREYVIKVFNKPTKCEKEKRILKKLNDSRYVVRLVDVNSEDSDLCFIVMEKLGGMLDDFEPQTIEELFYAFRKAFEALDYVHSQGVAHLDAHFENFLILRRGYKLEVKLIDFERSVDQKAESSFKFDETTIVEQIEMMIGRLIKKYEKEGKMMEVDVLSRVRYLPGRYSKEDHRAVLTGMIEDALAYKREVYDRCGKKI